MLLREVTILQLRELLEPFKGNATLVTDFLFFVHDENIIQNRELLLNRFVDVREGGDNKEPLVDLKADPTLEERISDFVRGHEEVRDQDDAVQFLLYLLSGLSEDELQREIDDYLQFKRPTEIAARRSEDRKEIRDNIDPTKIKRL